MSDLHLGSSSTDVKAIKEELRQARANDDRVLIGGDVIDGILPTDRKRYRPSAVHPDLRGRDDLLNGQVELATEVLAPYAHLIDGVATGNHESAVEHHHHYDPVRHLIQNLNRAGGMVQPLGYTALIPYRAPKSRTYSVFFTHGEGRATGPVGVAKKLTSMAWARAELYWLGHFHQKMVFQQDDLDFSDGKPKQAPRWFVGTGAYLRTYPGQKSNDIWSNGRQSNYAADLCLRPQGLGGVRVVFDPNSGIKVEL